MQTGRLIRPIITTPNQLRINDMMQSVIACVQEDPFSGKPFCYRMEGQGFTLYSVGEDGRDDGGKPSVKRGPRDIVWCVAGK